jgi:hypothetical protein
MTLRELDTVVLERDLPSHGLRRGDVGAVVHVHSATAVEVEFVRASGQTQALVEVAVVDLRPVSDDDLLAVRHIDPSTRGAA